MYAGFSSFITIGFIVFLFFMSRYMNFFVFILGFLSYFYYIGTYTATFLINPGYPQKYLQEEIACNKNLRFCSHCRIYYESGKQVVHCRDCK
ncbi:MAG: hypothetical protein MJ252_00235 [archaeon]|nr:hypothetical protein [archaeon]